MRDYVNAQKYSHLVAGTGAGSGGNGGEGGGHEEKGKGSFRHEEEGDSLAELGTKVGVGLNAGKWPKDNGNRRRTNGTGDSESSRRRTQATEETTEEKRKDQPHIPPDFFRLQTRLEPPHIHSLNQTLVRLPSFSFFFLSFLPS